MLNGSSGIPFTMNVEPSGSNCGGFGGNGWGEGWWIILLFIILAGYGNGYGNGGFGGYGGGYVSDNYALITDNATLERKIDGVYSGICDSTFALNNTITNGFAAAQNTMTQGFAGLNTAIVQDGYENRIATQGVGNTVQNCCCDLKQQIGDVKYTIGSTGAEISRGVERGFSDTNYNLASQSNGITNAIQTGFCQTNFNAQTNTRDIIDATNAGFLALDNKIDAIRYDMMRDKYEAERDAKFALQGKLDRAELRTDIVNDVRPCPIPAYPACNPWGCNCNCNNGCA